MHNTIKSNDVFRRLVRDGLCSEYSAYLLNSQKASSIAAQIDRKPIKYALAMHKE